MRQSIVHSFTFHAAHHLSWHPGRCAQVHGHTYRFEARIDGELGENGVIVDFDELVPDVTRLVLDVLDHSDLNLRFVNPTAEILAAWIFLQLETEYAGVVEVRLWETPEASVVVSRD